MTKHEQADAFCANCMQCQKTIRPATLIQVVCLRIHFLFKGVKERKMDTIPHIEIFMDFLKIIRAGFLLHNASASSIWLHVRESGYRNPENVCLWNVESWTLDSRIQIKESGILLTIRIRNPWHGMQNPRLSWIPLNGAIKCRTSFHLLLSISTCLLAFKQI